MAESSQYAIQLKAILDTTDVQNKLNQLRMAQNQINSQGGGRGGAGGNLGNLGNTLQKLNNSIVGLQKSIDVLGRNFRGASMQTGRGAPAPYSVSQPMMVNQPFRNAIAKPTVTLEDRRIAELEIRQSLQARLERIRRFLVEAEQHPEREVALNRAKIEGRRMSKDIANYHAHRVEWAKRYAEQMAYNRDKAVLESPENRQNLLFNRGAMAYIGGNLIGSLGDALWDPKGGYSARNRGSVFVSALGQGIQQAGMGGMVGGQIGGPWGATAGLLIGWTKGLFEEAFKGRAKMDDYVQAQNEKREALINRSDFGAQQARSSLLFTRELQSARRFRDIPYAREMERSYAARAERAQLDFLGMQTPGEYLKGLLGDRSLDNETIQKRLQAYQQEYDNAQKLMQITQQQADATKSLADEMQRFKEQTEAVARAFNNAMGARNLTAISNAEEFGVDRILKDQVRRQQVFANEVLSNEELTPGQQFTQLTESLEQARRSRNQYLNQAYALNRDAQLGNHSAAEREDIIRRRDWAMRQAGVQGDMASILENALKEIQVQNWRPNLQNLTSLSQFGFGMGEKDDGVDIMERYWSRQIDLTRQIRDKLDEGPKSEAVYQ